MWYPVALLVLLKSENILVSRGAGRTPCSIPLKMGDTILCTIQVPFMSASLLITFFNLKYYTVQHFEDHSQLHYYVRSFK